MHPEQKIAVATLCYNGFEPNFSDLNVAKEQMRKLYYIVDVNEMSPTFYWHGGGPFFGFDHKLSHWHLSINKIEDV